MVKEILAASSKKKFCDKLGRGVSAPCDITNGRLPRMSVSHASMKPGQPSTVSDNSNVKYFCHTTRQVRLSPPIHGAFEVSSEKEKKKN